MPEYIFKTIYFPKERVRIGKSARVNISLPAKPRDGITKEFITYLRGLNSRDFRLALGDPIVEDLEAKAHEESRSLSNICVSILKKGFNNGRKNGNGQMSFDFGTVDMQITNEGETSVGLTFQDSLRQGIYGWYPYVEGFSATYARDSILRNRLRPQTIYDPFGGSGTVQLAASMLGIQSFYSELNPFMSFVAETKILSVRWAKKNWNKFNSIATEYLKVIDKNNLVKARKRVSLEQYYEAFPKRDYFEDKHIRELLAALSIAEDISDGYQHACNILMLACTSNAVACSNMTRRADLRRRRPDEYKNRVVNVSGLISDSVKRMVQDVKSSPTNIAYTKKVSSDSKSIPDEYRNAFDLVLTSPPYLNGTNYFRNTKIELWLLGFIKSEKELRGYRNLTVTGGINDVSKKESYFDFKKVEKIAKQLDLESKDKRIPTMARHYFSDMYEVFKGVFNSMKPGGDFVLDIGDSKFYGVHVPTNKLLIDVAREAGFNVKNEHILAKRMSRDKSELVQAEIIFEKPKNVRHIKALSKKCDSLGGRIKQFQRELPYKNQPYSKKTWGHPLHSLCSYQGKLKPSMSHWLVKYFVPKGGSLLDPLGGVGTIPFEGAMQGVNVVTNDKSPFAALIGRAKLRPPFLSNVRKSIQKLQKEASKVNLTKNDFNFAEFGLNSSVKDYYHKKTLKEILKLRKIFLKKKLDQRSDSENFVWASLLHVLHGNRPYALSCTSHPITPFSPSGPKVYKDVYKKIYERAERALSKPLSKEFQKGLGIHGDFRDIKNHINHKFDAIITSPPFYGMRFDRPNWLRLWFCGWSESNFKEDSLEFLERQQIKNISVYREFFSLCKSMIKKNGLLILHLGGGGRKDMVNELKAIALEYFTLEGEVIENVQTVAKHGIKDKGLTTTHSLLFFKPSK